MDKIISTVCRPLWVFCLVWQVTDFEQPDYRNDINPKKGVHVKQANYIITNQ